MLNNEVNMITQWSETFESWLREAKWSKKGYLPSMEEYLRNGMISIATHTIVLPTLCLMESCFPQHKLKPGNYDNITTLLMTVTRLLNDLQSYQVMSISIIPELIYYTWIDFT